MSEESDSAFPFEALELRPQVSPFIPLEIKDLRLSEQLPKGLVAYVDISEPSTFRLIDQTSWRPVQKGDVEKRFPIEQFGKMRFAGVVLHTPPRNHDNSYEEEIESLVKRIKRSSEKEDGIIQKHHSGTLFIVEDKGEDTKTGWRERQMRKHSLVVDRQNGERAVIIGENYILTQGRRPKQRSAVNLMKGKASGNMFGDFPDSIERWAQEQGLEADTSRLREEARATKFPPGTINNLKEGGNTVFKGVDENGKYQELGIDKRGVQTAIPNIERFKNTRVTPEKKELPKPGDVILRKDLKCPLGHTVYERYRIKQGRVRELLVRDIVCDQGHPDGYPWYFGRDKYIRALGLLPESLRKK